MYLRPSMLIMLLFPGWLFAQTYSFSLAEAQAFALENSYDMQYALMDEAIAERDIKIVGSAGLPQVNASIDYNNYIDIPVQVAPADAFGFPPYLTNFLGAVSEETGVPLNAPQVDPDAVSEFQFGAPQTMTAGIAVSQLVFDGSYFVGRQAAKAYAEVARMTVDRTELQVRSAVSEAYHTVLLARENVSILQDSRGVLEQTLNETIQFYENGFVEEQDVDQLRLSLADLDARINFAEQQALIALDLLKFQLGLPMNADVTVTDSVESLLSKGNDPLTKAFSLEAIPDVAVQRGNLNMAEWAMKNEQAKRLPSIGAFYNYQRNAQRDEFNFLDFDENWFPIQLWGVQFKMPIFGGFSRKHEIAKAKINQEKALVALKQISAGAELEYATALNEYRNAVENERIQNGNLELANKIFNTTQIKYSEGVSTSFELTQAQNQLLTAQGNQIQATLQLLNTKTRLNKSINNF